MEELNNVHVFSWESHCVDNTVFALQFPCSLLLCAIHADPLVDTWKSYFAISIPF